MEVEDKLFEKLALTEEEKQMFEELKSYNSQLRDSTFREESRKDWGEVLESGGTLSFKLYMSLTSRGILVKFNKYCLKNRSDDVGGGPELAKFHSHVDVISNIVSFIEFPHVHDEIGDVTLGVRFPSHLFSKRRCYPDDIGRVPISFTRIIDGWKCSIWFDEIISGRSCSKFLDALESIEACILPDRKVLEDEFERLWNKASEGVEPGFVRKRLDSLVNWISSSEKGRPEWV